MSARRKFILFELNEVPFRVYRHYADRNPRSAVARLLAHGRRFDTLSEDEGHLSPWVTWPTLHRGVTNADHHISSLGQDVSQSNALYPPVWELLARGGRSVGMFGSLHTYPMPAGAGDYAFYLPDTFAATPEAHPAELSAFQAFNLAMVDRSGRNVSAETPYKQAISLLGGLRKMGLRAVTVGKIMRQLASERIMAHRAGRRRTIQSLLSFDLFLHQLADKKPDSAFYFTNHVASSMHRYWPATFGEDYSQTEWKPDWSKRFGGEIDYAMGEADAMLAEMIAFTERNPDYLLLVTGSMGQAAVDEPGNQLLTQVLLTDAPRFVKALGVAGAWERKRTMEPAYTFQFAAEADADLFCAALERLSIGGVRPDFHRLDAHGVELSLGQGNVPDDALDLLLGNVAMTPEELGIANVRIQDEVGSAAYHVPEGVLFSYDPQADGGGERARETISTTRIAPTLLAMQGVERPAYMREPIEELVKGAPVPA